ncbi:MAG: DUF5698 domain-containing protein [Flavobacteriales bacterium]|jgi:uncharacterized protein YebE (UPF0316 family)|tara:strand:- start:13693 stop:14193 length:501 start_codon:yes stop_codon:yes gene_type:complete
MTVFIAALSIFFLRLSDQSLGTIRALLITKNKPLYAGLIGLIESVIWILAVSKVIEDIDDNLLIAGYALGFAAGTIIGSYIEGFMGFGDMVIRVFSSIDDPSVADPLRKEGFGVTVINGEGLKGAVRIYWCIAPKRKLKTALKIIESTNPNAYVTTDLANPRALRK